MALADIETIVVVMLENRSFDHMLGYRALAPGRTGGAVEGLSADPAWLAAHANLLDGAAIQSRRLEPDDEAIADPKHNRQAITVQIGTAPADPTLAVMGGFARSYVDFLDPPPSDPSQVMGYYDEAALPVFDFLAQNFAVCDHWFSPLPTGTQPNRLMAMSGQSPIADNAGLLLPDLPLVYDWLTDHQVSWSAYQSGGFFPFFSLLPRLLPEIVASLTLSQLGVRGRWRRYGDFAAHWASGEAMPTVIFIEPEYSDGPHVQPNDDHSPTGVARGQAFIADIYQALIANPRRWARTMMIVVYDEHGGFYDHVPPLAIPTLIGPDFRFDTTGVRVPALVVSPQVEAGSVFPGPLDHTSILRLLVERFDPGHGYSPAVDARQIHLASLADVLTAPASKPRAPAIGPSVLAEVRARAAAIAPTPARGALASDPPNARALHEAAVKAQADHPDLMAQPGWEAVTDYLAAARPGGAEQPGERP